MTTKTEVTTHGVTTGGLLGVAFVILKLMHIITWPWKWVLAPFWIPWVIFVVVMLGILGTLFGIFLWEEYHRYSSRKIGAKKGR